MLTVFRDLEKHRSKAVRVSANLLVKMVQNSILSLCFSDGQNQAVDTDSRITVLEVTGLDLPTDEKDELSDSQIKSLVVMYALGHYCHKFGSENRKQETIIFLMKHGFSMRQQQLVVALSNALNVSGVQRIISLS